MGKGKDVGGKDYLGAGMVSGVDGEVTAKEIQEVAERFRDFMNFVVEGNREGTVEMEVTVPGGCFRREVGNYEFSQRDLAIVNFTLLTALERGAKWERVNAAMVSGAPAEFAVLAGATDMPLALIEKLGPVLAGALALKVEEDAADPDEDEEEDEDEEAVAINEELFRQMFG